MVISVYSTVAAISRDLDDPRVALHWWEKTGRYRKLTLPDNHPDFALTVNSFALVKMALKQYKNSLEPLRPAWNIRKKSLLSQHSHFVQAYKNVALFCQHQTELSAALLFYCKAVPIALDA